LSRTITIAAAQSGPIARDERRAHVLDRRIAQLREAHRLGCELVVFPECALTAFFPHWWIEDEAELDAWYERELPGPLTRALFDEAARLKTGFCLGYSELAIESGVKRRFNSSILVERDGRIVGKYRKIHLPGHVEHRPNDPFQNLEKRYFEVGNLGFPTWRAFGGVMGMCICNDRRWPEAYRVLGLGGAEMVLIGYNTPDHVPGHEALDRLVNFHNRLSMQAGAYQNGCWVIGVAKAGVEEGVSQIGDSVIVAPSGEIAAASSTMGDELVVHRCDLDAVKPYKEFVFNFERNRRIEHYGPIASQTAAAPPS
jgi:predicted amidohydrolase